jgi:AMMECR1 domain-containing protein
LLNCGVSLLTQFEGVDNPLDWEVGKHGIEIEFEHRNKYYSSTFLPEVAEEQNWDQKETLIYLVDKAGYSGKLESIISKIKTKRYQSLKAHLSYAEYTRQKL